MDRIEKLIKMLDSPKASTRYDACEWLRVAPSLNDAAIAALERASKDSDPEVRDAAQRALNLHQMDEIEKFIKILESPKASARYDACESLRVARSLDDVAIAALHRALNDPDPEVRDAARRAINAHETASPHPKANTREGPGLFLACEGEEVVQALPKVCLYCGQPATQVKRQVFSHQPDWGCLVDMILFWLYWTGTGERKVTMKVPVCERHFKMLRRREALRLGAFFAIITPLLVGAVSDWLGWSLSELLPGNSFRTVLWIWFGAWFLLLALAAFVDRVSRGVRVVDIDDTGIWLEGVASEFSSAVTKSADVTD